MDKVLEVFKIQSCCLNMDKVLDLRNAIFTFSQQLNGIQMKGAKRYQKL